MIGTRIKVEDLSDGFDYRYRVTCLGIHLPSGEEIGEGIGEASTQEKKYAWRAAVCDDEFESYPENRRQIAYKKYKDEVSTVKQVRQNPADISNTVLKMAKKRAQVDLCLSATACSDCFTQDLDEDHIREATIGNGYQQPQRKRDFASEDRPRDSVADNTRPVRQQAPPPQQTQEHRYSDADLPQQPPQQQSSQQQEPPGLSTEQNQQDLGTCRKCGADNVFNPKTGKTFCKDKCWLKDN